MKKTLPDIQTIREVVGLLKRANVEPYALLSETASCLGVKKTVLMAFIDGNPDLFVCRPVREGRRNLGLGIHDVYTVPKDNPHTEAWLQAVRESFGRTLFIRQVWEYDDHVREEYVAEDRKPYSSTLPESHEDRPWEWRNTADKIEALKASGHYTESSVGWGTSRETVYLLSKEHREALLAEGWALAFFR